jgi:hypothetical protein
MQAEGIKAGDRSVMYDDKGRVLSGWTATGDAVVEGNDVYVPVRHLDGGDGTRIFTKGTQVPLSFGVGGPPPIQP